MNVKSSVVSDGVLLSGGSVYTHTNVQPFSTTDLDKSFISDHLTGS